MQNPSMLDNVSAQDFQSNDDATQSDQTYQLPNSDSSVVDNTSATAPTTPQIVFSSSPQPVVEHPITTDDPFVQVPSATAPTQPAKVLDFSSSTSSPAPQAFTADDPADTSTYISTITDDGIPEVDHAKLAEMKQQALAHLEPLAEHLDGTPEETFKTTMMMIQANDNHTLLEKALNAAKNIQDDKVRAQAMLDIVNEINYFSQNN